MNSDYLHCYKMTDDTGFAPNPYHNVLTLATCKPRIRLSAQDGQWISGWTSKIVNDKDGNKVAFTDCKLIYLAKIAKKISFEQYWKDYPQKRPKTGIDCGDNIYRPKKDGADVKDINDFESIAKKYHDSLEDRKRDLSGQNVLICDEFYYFGVHNALNIDNCDFCNGIPKWRWKKISLKDPIAENIIKTVINNRSKAILSKTKPCI